MTTTENEVDRDTPVEGLALRLVREVTDEVRAFQRDVLNPCAVQLRLPLAIEDGWFGPETAAHCGEVLWHLGLLEEPACVTQLTRAQQRLIEDPFPEPDEVREPRQRQLARRRQRRLGGELTPDDLGCGLTMLRLIGDWRAWVHRRVDEVTYSTEDENTLVRRRIMEFVLPDDVLAAWATMREADVDDAPVPVPAVLAEKWKVPRFDFRDERGRALPVASREESLAWSAGALIAYAYDIVGSSFLDTELQMPRTIEEDLRAIVHDEAPAALAICHMLGAMPDEDAGPEERKRIASWRQALVTNEGFMELAFEFAQNFLVVVWCWPPLGEPRMLVGTYEPRHTSPRWVFARRWKGWRRDVREAAEDARWPLRRGDPAPEGFGRFAITAVCATLVVGSRQELERPVCADVAIVADNGATLKVPLTGNDVHERSNVPPGHYRIDVIARPGFQLLEPAHPTLDVEALSMQRVTLTFVQTRLVGDYRSARRGVPFDAPPPPARSRLSRALGWRSKLVLVSLRASEGGSYHFEFEAPSGIQVTRAKLADDRLGELDIAFESCQRTHLYVPAEYVSPASAYALINLRPRGDTIVRSSALTSTIVAAVISVVAWRIVAGHALNAGAAALVLAVPGGLAAYVAQAVPSRVTEKLLLGLRLTALLPALLAVAAAGVIALGDGGDEAQVAMVVLAVLAITVAIVTWGSVFWTARRPEQKLTEKAQSSDFIRRYYRRSPTG